MIKMSINDLNKMAENNLLPNGTRVHINYFCPPQFGDWRAVEPFVYNNKFISISKKNKWEDVVATANDKENGVIVWADIYSDLFMFDLNHAVKEMEERMEKK